MITPLQAGIPGYIHLTRDPAFFVSPSGHAVLLSDIRYVSKLSQLILSKLQSRNRTALVHLPVRLIGGEESRTGIRPCRH